MYKSFSELPIWQKGLELLKMLYRNTDNFPKEEKFGLLRDVRRSANSVIANIAESHGRFHYADKIRVLYISRGEINETRSHLLVAKELNYLSNDIYNKMENDYILLEKHLNLHINSLRKNN